MLKLIKLSPGRWIIKTDKSQSPILTVDIACAHLFHFHHVEMAEIDFALDEMTVKNHNVADFGINRLFIFSIFQNQGDNYDARDEALLTGMDDSRLSGAV